MPIIFTQYSDIAEWWDSMKKLLRFVKTENEHIANESRVKGQNSDGNGPEPQRVKLTASRLTCDDDAERAIYKMLMFMGKVFKGEVPDKRVSLYGDCEWLFAVRFDQEVGPCHEVMKGFSVIMPHKMLGAARRRVPAGELEVLRCNAIPLPTGLESLLPEGPAGKLDEPMHADVKAQKAVEDERDVQQLIRATIFGDLR